MVENQKESMLMQVKNQITTYCKQIAYLNDLFELQRELTPIEDDKEWLEGVCLINAAAYDAAFIAIAKLVSDKGEQTANIWKLIETIRKNDCLFEEEIRINILRSTDECEQKLTKDYKHVINKIKARRDRLIVHNDRKYFGKMEKYTEIIHNYELWEVSAVIDTYLSELVKYLGISISTTGKYVECKDLRKVIDSGIFSA